MLLRRSFSTLLAIVQVGVMLVAILGPRGTAPKSNVILPPRCLDTDSVMLIKGFDGCPPRPVDPT